MSRYSKSKTFNDKKYLLAVSGGIDSMVMLNLFLKFKLNFIKLKRKYRGNKEKIEINLYENRLN